MKAFYGSRISENMTVTPDGFLVCHNVPIARTGWYDYLPQEIGVKGDGIVKVYRSPEEVFSKQAMASFEGKPTTDEHPPDLLTPDNSAFYTKGAVQNVRRSPTEQDLLLADLIIYNSTLIDEIMNKGKREVSCGYECNYVDNRDRTYSQVQICGNHVAVVEAGRAGDRVAIKDSKNQNIEGGKKKMKIPKQQRGPVTNFFAALGIKHFAKDAEPEEISEALDALAEERQEGEGGESEKKGKESESTQANDEGGNTEIAEIKEAIANLTQVVTQLTANKATDEEKKPEDAIDELIGELAKGEKSTGDEEESVTVPVDEMDEDIPDGVVTDPEDRPENPIANSDSIAMIRALKAMKPVISAIKDPTERKKACDSLIAEFKNAKKQTKKGNGYQNILNAQRKNSQSKAQKAADSAEKNYEKIDNGYANLNPHKTKKEMK